jgi:hypothetical protein
MHERKQKKPVKTQRCTVSQGKYDINPIIHNCLESLFLHKKLLGNGWVLPLLKKSIKSEQKQRSYGQKTAFSPKTACHTQFWKKLMARGRRARNANRKMGVIISPTAGGVLAVFRVPKG